MLYLITTKILNTTHFFCKRTAVIFPLMILNGPFNFRNSIHVCLLFGNLNKPRRIAFAAESGTISCSTFRKFR